MESNKARVFWPLLLAVFLTDCATKRVAEVRLAPEHVPREVLGDVVRLTLAYNPGMATGIPLGPYSRVVLSILALAAIAVVARFFRRVPAHDRWLGAALALVAGGALGNLLDRLRSPRGVVDFIDIGVGTVRFWTFNVADVGVIAGAALLALLLWRRGESVA